MGHREFLLCDNKLTHLHRRLSNTRMRPPQSGLVQVGFWEVSCGGYHSQSMSANRVLFLDVTGSWRFVYFSLALRGVRHSHRLLPAPCDSLQLLLISSNSTRAISGF